MEKNYLAGLHYIGFSQKKLHEVFSKSKNYKGVFDGINYDYLYDLGFKRDKIKLILERYKNLDLNYINKKLISRAVEIITFNCDNYPHNLKNISNPPFLFYLRGKIDNSPKISVIGSRIISEYGKKSIESIIPDISKYFSIVSGGADGCDTKSHIEALNNKNKTISVIGTGIDIDYPIRNKSLFDNIVNSGGGILSIFPIGEPGNPYNFPVRNEVVAGLSQGILIIEAREKSGSLITAKLGLEMGKDLFAIPGDIHKLGSVGTNNLIKNSEAKLIMTGNDILEDYNISSDNKSDDIGKEINISDPVEKSIYDLLILDQLTLDDISLKLGINIRELSLKISNMELCGIINKNISGKYEIN